MYFTTNKGGLNTSNHNFCINHHLADDENVENEMFHNSDESRILRMNFICR